MEENQMDEYFDENGNKKKDENLKSQNFFSSFGFFFCQSFKDARRHKCQYCLGFCSVFVVVLMTLIINTVIDKGPIIFLRLAEGNVGEIDALIESSHNANGNIYEQVNLTQINSLYPGEYSLAGRKSREIGYANLGTNAGEDPETGLPILTYNDVRFVNFESGGNYKLINIDTEQEKKIKCGKDYKYEKLELGECLISEDFSSVLGKSVGDVVLLEFAYSHEMKILWDHYKVRSGDNSTYVPTFASTIAVPCKIAGVHSGSGGKLASSDDSKAVFMEIEHYYKWISPYVELNDISASMVGFRAFLRGEYARPNDFADYVIMNFPDPRIDFYKQSDYDQVQDKVVGYTNVLVNKLGFFPESVTCEILEELQTLSLGLVFLGIIFSIVAILFVVISILLIYSLLMVTVEEKSFEIGIYRMVGVNKIGLITMVLLKAFFFVLPAIIAGFIISMICLWLIYKMVFNAAMGTDLAPIPTLEAAIYALSVGILIPLIASLYPMKIILSRNLTDALNYSTSKTKAVFVKIVHAKDFDRKPYIIFGTLSVVYGLSIYYFLPLSLISLNFGLMLTIFFLILIGMFCGMVLLALNLQRILEIFFVYFFLFYERVSTRMLVLKNMVAHKPRNRTTILIYAMSVGFLIMIIVSYNLELMNSQAIQQLEEGNLMYVEALNGGSLYASTAEVLLADVEDKIEYLGYETHAMEDNVNGIPYKNMITSDKLQLVEFETSMFGLSPFFGETLMKKYIKTEKTNSSTALDLIEQLYTPRGMQGAAMPGYIRSKLGLNPKNWNHTMKTTLYTYRWNAFTLQRCLWSSKIFPGKDMIERENGWGYDLLVSVPTYKKLLGVTTNVADFPYKRLAIKLKNPSSSADIKAVRDAINAHRGARNAKVYDHVNDSGNLDTAATLLDLIFNIIIAAVMFLCYFALSSSMTANMLEQKKEIGVLRAIGMKKSRIYFLYIYECFIMIFTGCMTGILVGTLIGWTMMLQRVLFTNVPMPFYFPWMQIIVMFFVSILCAVLATVFPARQILKKEISQIFRSA